MNPATRAGSWIRLGRPADMVTAEVLKPINSTVTVWGHRLAVEDQLAFGSMGDVQ